MEVRHLNFYLPENSLVEGAKKILPVFKPDWDLSTTKFKIFTNGITNKLLGCFNPSLENDVLLIRVYGNKTDLLIDRKKETENIKILCSAGLAPSLHGTFTNGLVYGYAPGEVLNVKTCRQESIFVLVAKKLADLHSVEANQHGPEPALWKIIDRFLANIPEKYSNETKGKRFNEVFLQHLNIEKEYSFLKNELSHVQNPVVFCHNDLLLDNVVYNSKSQTVTFIDFEYSDFNYQAFDLANHFNEFAGVDKVDYSLFPNESFQKNWLQIYLKKYKENITKCINVEVDPEEVNELYSTVQKFTLASHFLWGAWALVQVEFSSINFDYLNYALIRFTEYNKKKKEIYGI